MERGDERETGPSWYILLLEGGAPPASQCSTASRDRRDKARVRRTRGRIFYHAFGNAVGGERQDVWRLFARRSGRPGNLEWARCTKARDADCREPEALEGHQELLTVVERTS